MAWNVPKRLIRILDDPIKNLDNPLTNMKRVNRLVVPDHFPDPNFRLNAVRVAEHGSSHVQHSHEFEELVVILGGNGKHQVGNEIYDISDGDVFVILGKMSHCYPETNRLSLINILYDTNRLRIPLGDLRVLPGYHALFQVEPKLRQKKRFKNRLKLKLADLGRLVGMVSEMEAELHSKSPGSHFLGTAHFMRIVGLLSRVYSKMPVERGRPISQISELLSYMEQHYAQPLKIEDLTKLVHMSQSTLFRVFRQAMGRSPMDYLIRLRVRKATQLLHRESMRISEISEVVGFEDSNYFSRQFHMVMGVSPRAYRDRLG